MDLQILLYILLAMFLGGLIGLEREMADKPAGLSRFTLAIGATLLTLLILRGMKWVDTLISKKDLEGK